MLPLIDQCSHNLFNFIFVQNWNNTYAKRLPGMFPCWTEPGPRKWTVIWEFLSMITSYLSSTRTFHVTEKWQTCFQLEQYFNLQGIHLLCYLSLLFLTQCCLSSLNSKQVQNIYQAIKTTQEKTFLGY